MRVVVGSTAILCHDTGRDNVLKTCSCLRFLLNDSISMINSHIDVLT